MATQDVAAGAQFTLQKYFTPDRTPRLRRFPHLARLALRIVWRAAPRQLLLSAAVQVIVGVGLTAQILLVRSLLTHVVSDKGSLSVASTLPQVIGLAVIAALVSASSALLEGQQRLLGQLVSLHTTDEVIRTTSEVDLITFDAPGFHDRLQRAALSAGHRPADMVGGLLGFIGTGFAIGGIAIALLIIQPVFCAFTLAAFVPVWIAANYASRLVYRYSVEQTERERKRMYLFELLTSKREAQEVRAFDLGHFLGARYRAIYERLIEDLRAVIMRRVKVSLVGVLVTTTLTALGLAGLVWFVATGRASLATAGSAVGAMVLLTSRLRTLAGGTAGLYESSLYLEDYASFVAARPRIRASRPTREPILEPQFVDAESLTFSYPSGTRPAVEDCSLVLRRGEVVALVGENGSGKTTLAKLLAGLYQPDFGTIRWDGVDVAKYDPASVRARVAVIFQDFVRYLLSARDNIALGQHTRAEDLEAVEHAARAAGVHERLMALPDGYETLLGPEYFGGSELSGGQWQRLALARAFFRDAPIVILDEPTASLDARAEAALYDSMRDLFVDRAVLLISHRFGSVRTADRIYVLRDGLVHEQGSHDELMDLDGYYAELFRLQARSYVATA